MYNVLTSTLRHSVASYCELNSLQQRLASHEDHLYRLLIPPSFHQVKKAQDEVEAIANAPAPEAAAPAAVEVKAEAAPAPAEGEEVDIDLNDPEVAAAATKIQVRGQY